MGAPARLFGKYLLSVRDGGSVFPERQTETASPNWRANSVSKWRSGTGFLMATPDGMRRGGC
jgi:hypothetical protein